jgi:hypothetical protein
MNKILATLAVVAAVISTPALAQEGARGGYMQKDQTRAEAQQRADMLFQMLDANKDGTVTKAEADESVTPSSRPRAATTMAGGAPGLCSG